MIRKEEALLAVQLNTIIKVRDRTSPDHFTQWLLTPQAGPNHSRMSPAMLLIVGQWQMVADMADGCGQKKGQSIEMFINYKEYTVLWVTSLRKPTIL